MNELDYAIIVVMLISIVIGVVRGALREIINIGSWILAFITAYFFASSIAPVFSDWIGEPVGRLVLAWVVVFVAILILAAMVANLLSEVVRKLGLTSLDRGVGALIGVARGLLVLIVLTLVAGMTRIPQSRLWRDAALTPWLEVTALYARSVLPVAVAEKIRYRAPPVVKT